MVLKKQTVWLITMLSLLIVLSVYYMTAPDDMAVVDQDDEQQDENNGEENGEGGTESEGTNVDVSGMTVDELFTTTRLEQDETRSQQIEQWEDVIASANASSEEKNEAKEQINEILTVSQKEAVLENTIRYDKDYRDVLVQKDEDDVRITVITDELSKTEANELMQMARDEFGMMNVIVGNQKDDNQEEDNKEDDNQE
ncbi:SpoIIIAH-like family protein [Aquisalibacillus elongatus]|uniref:Stage III sporulation protein AH n=1 Tax=Aquisalibacillus elongatus TaxID=485577 RepID=A0A3N5C835_9BACI|nr:SpoIIIAH-like family protein [Aquisalibacillus elongatus]RPF55662.1 stage III sporulation protein AH [Aquisalibacillus elongatus]